MKKTTKNQMEIATRVWKRMFSVLMSSSQARSESLLRRGLTPNDAKALWSLERDAGRPIGELAKEWGCDPSNATFIIDRLEKHGLAERRASTTDRRVKIVVLTQSGAKTKLALEVEYHRPPPELLGLSESELKALDEALSRIG